MKQVVIETLRGQDVEVKTSYEFDADLVGKKEREEVVIGNVTKYWINVPDPTVKPISYKNRKKEISRKFHLIAAKRERLRRYAEMIAAGGEIVPSDEDVQKASELAHLVNRQVDVKKLKKFFMVA